MELQFRPIPLGSQGDLDIAYAFRMERISPDFDPETELKPRWPTAVEYAAWLKERQDWDMDAVVHVWAENKIIGQIENFVTKDAPHSIGYVNFYYLIATLRNQGIGSQLVGFTDQLFKKRQMQSYQLSTTWENVSARRFYAKNGFVELGPRPHRPDHVLLSKTLL